MYVDTLICQVPFDRIKTLLLSRDVSQFFNYKNMPSYLCVCLSHRSPVPFLPLSFLLLSSTYAQSKTPGEKKFLQMKDVSEPFLSY